MPTVPSQVPTAPRRPPTDVIALAYHIDASRASRFEQRIEAAAAEAAAAPETSSGNDAGVASGAGMSASGMSASGTAASGTAANSRGCAILLATAFPAWEARLESTPGLAPAPTPLNAAALEQELAQTADVEKLRRLLRRVTERERMRVGLRELLGPQRGGAD